MKISKRWKRPFRPSNRYHQEHPDTNTGCLSQIFDNSNPGAPDFGMTPPIKSFRKMRRHFSSIASTARSFVKEKSIKESRFFIPPARRALPEKQRSFPITQQRFYRHFPCRVVLSCHRTSEATTRFIPNVCVFVISMSPDMSGRREILNM